MKVSLNAVAARIPLRVKRWASHVWWAPSYYAMRACIFRMPEHPFHRVPDIYNWAAHSTPLLRQWNFSMWLLIALECFMVYLLAFH